MTDRILRGARAMGIALTDAAASAMARYWQGVLEVNRAMNLTRIVVPEAVCADHFLDSLAPLAWGDAWLPRTATFLDIGTGAGFPGVPLALARPDLRATLIDARRKKADFVREALASLGRGDVRALHRRAQDMEETFDVVAARAVAALPALCDLALARVAPGGIAILWKGPAANDEWEEAEKVCGKRRAKLLPPLPYEIPGTERNRRLVIASRRA